MATRKRSKAKKVLSRYDSADYLTTEAGIAEYLCAATEEAGDVRCTCFMCSIALPVLAA
jgi:DNA-binding phage protein